MFTRFLCLDSILSFDGTSGGHIIQLNVDIEVCQMSCKAQLCAGRMSHSHTTTKKHHANTSLTGIRHSLEPNGRL
jgi:hypothetical protein